MKTTRYGETVTTKKHKKLNEFMAVALMCDESNHKWWRIRVGGVDDIDLGIKTFSNIDNIVYEDGEIYEKK
jgi:hypothetical protein